MLLKDNLRKIAITQRDALSAMEYGVEREELGEMDLDSPFAVVLTGIRRCGKSTLLRQLTRKVDRFYYFNFEDPRIAGFRATDFPRLDEALREEFGECRYYFFDEVQNAERWELFVRARLDSGKRFVLTGSNASLLSRELGTRLTGRHMDTELFPFSFREALTLKGQKPSAEALAWYMQNGGFPAYLISERPERLRELLTDILERDIMIRHKLRDVRTVREMALYLLTNAGKEFSYNGLRQLFNLGSATTVRSFLSFFEDSYLVFTIPLFDYSLKKQLVNAKKVYSIDPGLSHANSASFSEDRGHVLENTVFLHLRRKHPDIFYYRRKNECDFVIKERNRISSAFQVCHDLTEDNQEREVNGLLEALKEFRLSEGLILTFDQEDRLVVDGKRIMVKPAWKWMAES